jgi:uncharacterized oligopeptide transporter (OPT) family protein
MLLAVANVYVGLKTGWWESGTIIASVLAFSVMSVLTRRRAVPYSPLENNLTQTTAVSVGAMPAAAGLLGAIPALELLGVRPPAWGIACWGIALGVLGVLTALALRRRLLEDEALPFPTGVATAEVISTLHASEKAHPGRARVLLGSGAAALVLTWLRDAPPRWLPPTTLAPGSLLGVPARTFTLGLSWSPLLFAIGLVAGPQVGLSMLLGALVAWGVVAPALVHTGLVGSRHYEDFIQWLTWPGVGLMLGAGLVSLAAQARTFLDAARDLRALGRGRAGGGTRVALLLALAAGTLAFAVGALVLRLPPLQLALALLLLFPLCGVCARATGQTDISPVSQVGQLAQLADGMLGSPAAAANVAAGSAVSGAAAQTGISLWALKAGHQLGASTRHQALAQGVGILVGAAVGVPAYTLLVRAYGLGTPDLPAPSAAQARALGAMATHGLAALPPGAAWAAFLAFAVGATLSLASRGRWARFVPSAAAMGIGFVSPAHYAVTLCLGALLAALVRTARPTLAGTYTPAVAAGAIAGESLMGVLIAALTALGAIA